MWWGCAGWWACMCAWCVWCWGGEEARGGCGGSAEWERARTESECCALTTLSERRLAPALLLNAGCGPGCAVPLLLLGGGGYSELVLACRLKRSMWDVREWEDSTLLENARLAAPRPAPGLFEGLG